MDALTHLLDGPRARGAFLLRTVMEPPWGVRIEDEAPLSLVAVVEGSTTYRPDDAGPVRLEAGDVAVVKGPAPYTFADDLGTPPRVRILPEQVCVDPDGELVEASMALGVRTWGNAHDGSTVLLIGTWHVASEVSRPLLAALPTCVVRRHGEWDASLVDVLVRETGRDAPGQAAVLDRLLDLVLVSVVRSWIETDDRLVPGTAHADAAVGTVLRLVHEAPDQPWTLLSLARAAGVSRAVLARRFVDLVGEPPIGYLTRWRLALAADLLLADDTGLEQVAQQVGYGSAFALSTAFKRHYGVSPREHRRSSRPAHPQPVARRSR